MKQSDKNRPLSYPQLLFSIRISQAFDANKVKKGGVTTVFNACTIKIYIRDISKQFGDVKYIIYCCFKFRRDFEMSQNAGNKFKNCHWHTSPLSRSSLHASAYCVV